MIEGQPPNKIRIIAGKWRGSKLVVVDKEGLRPSTDRARETLFNWLQPHLPGANVLDLFAGTGVLALEALSRGADWALILDNDSVLLDYIQQNVKRFEANAELSQANIPKDLKAALRFSHTQFNVVFMDPPFNKHLIKPSCEALEKLNCLAPDALIYIEAEKSLSPLPIPKNWQIIRNKTTKILSYYLIQRQENAS